MTSSQGLARGTESLFKWSSQDHRLRPPDPSQYTRQFEHNGFAVAVEADWIFISIGPSASGCRTRIHALRTGLGASSLTGFN
jgi:hypothetical protein